MQLNAPRSNVALLYEYLCTFYLSFSFCYLFLCDTMGTDTKSSVIKEPKRWKTGRLNNAKTRMRRKTQANGMQWFLAKTFKQVFPHIKDRSKRIHNEHDLKLCISKLVSSRYWVVYFLNSWISTPVVDLDSTKPQRHKDRGMTTSVHLKISAGESGWQEQRATYCGQYRCFRNDSDLLARFEVLSLVLKLVFSPSICSQWWSKKSSSVQIYQKLKWQFRHFALFRRTNNNHCTFTYSWIQALLKGYFFLAEQISSDWKGTSAIFRSSQMLSVHFSSRFSLYLAVIIT